jgi:hypothetical protein
VMHLRYRTSPCEPGQIHSLADQQSHSKLVKKRRTVPRFGMPGVPIGSDTVVDG